MTIELQTMQYIIVEKRIFMDTYELVVPCHFGLEAVTKREIYDLIKDLTNKGVSIILISSDLPELISLSNRIYVIHEGKVQGELLKKDASQEKIMTLATGGRL